MNKKLITRQGKGQKLTVQEMDGNLSYLEDTGLGINRGKIEPSDVDFSEIKNQFINKGDVSVSLGDTEITHDVVGFSSDDLSNYIIISDESSDIQSGDVLTISGDSEENLSFSITEYQLDNIIVEGETDLKVGSQFTITESDTEATVGIFSLLYPESLDGSTYTNISLDLGIDNSVPSNISSITITGSTERVFQNVELLGQGDATWLNSEDLERLTDKWKVSIDTLEEDISSYHLKGLNVTLTGTVDGIYDGTYQIIDSKGNSIFIGIETPLTGGELEVHAPFIGTPVTDENGEIVSYTWPTIDFTVPSNNGTYQVDGVIENSMITVVGAIRQNLPPLLSEAAPAPTYPTGTVSYTINFSGTYTVSNILKSIDEGGLSTITYISALEKSLLSPRPVSSDSIISYTVGSNNGSYVVSESLTGIDYNGVLVNAIRVEESVVSKSANLTATWVKSTRAEFSWIHAVLDNGIVIWEAYDYDSNENINGYWLAMKQNGEGEWEMVDFAKMTESFWNNWYEYTVKDPSNPGSVKLVGYDWENGGGQPWSSQSYAPKFYHCELTMNESLTELTVTESLVPASESTYLESIATELGVSSESISITNIQTPWWDSNDDWYGMMWGEKMGWIWFTVVDPNNPNITTEAVGFNMVSGEIQKYTLSQLNPFGINYSISSGWNEIMSHPKFGVLVTLDNGDNRYFYSPNFAEQKPTKISQPFGYNEVFSFESWQPGQTWDFSGKFLYVSRYNSWNSKTNYNLIRIDIENGEVEYGMIKDDDFRLDPYVKYYYTQGDWSQPYLENINQWSWAKHNGWISSVARWGEASYKAKNYVVWRDDEKKPKLVKIYSYPTNFTSNTAFTADFMWELPAIVSKTSTYKNNTF